MTNSSADNKYLELNCKIGETETTVGMFLDKVTKKEIVRFVDCLKNNLNDRLEFGTQYNYSSVSTSKGITSITLVSRNDKLSRPNTFRIRLSNKDCIDAFAKLV